MSKIHIACLPEDAGTAERLASELRSCGHQVRLAQWQLALGQTILTRLSRGAMAFDYLVVVFSGATIDSSSTDTKERAELTEQLGGPGIKVYPLADGEPTRTADIDFTDLMDDWSGQVKVLCRAIS